MSKIYCEECGALVKDDSQKTYEVDGVVYDFYTGRVTFQGKEVLLSPSEKAMLEMTVTAPNYIISRDAVINHIYTYVLRTEEPDSNSIRVMAYRLNKKFEKAFGFRAFVKAYDWTYGHNKFCLARRKNLEIVYGDETNSNYLQGKIK